ncbi:MAG: flagellar M-ring protein FliF C-terminal domain-containing protein [Tepidisphaeraceae bacterium]|jgi:flagellar biosynthesis/type III secretory pathway M-ring protein FliF/YscJ
MDILKAQLARIQQQLSGLTATQKMLAAALVAIMAMTLVWWGHYAAAPEYVALLDQSFSADDIAQITNHLAAKGISYTMSADRIMVPADRQIEVLADLGYSHLLPQNTSQGFDEIVNKQMTPWDTAEKDQHLWTEVKRRQLETILDEFPSVVHADVVIDPSAERRLDSGGDIKPTAMVSITTRHEPDQNDRQIGETVADLVAGAVAGLSRGRVTVVVDGATINVADKDGDGGLLDGDSIVQAIRAHEEYYRTKVLQQLGFISGLFVSVNVDLNTKRVESEQTVLDPKTSLHQTVTEEDHSVDTTSPGGGAGDAGAVSNVGSNTPLAVGGGGGAGGGTSTESESKATYQNTVASTVSHVIQGPGDAPAVSASVRVPRSYFVAIYHDVHKGADPDDAALDATINDELERIRKDVKSCTGIKSDDAVAVNWYSDGGVPPGGLIAAPSAVNSPVTLLLESHIPQIGVGGLAMLSLFMVMMMVRKSAPTPIPGLNMAGDEADEPPAAHLHPDAPVAGEVGEGDKTMDGMELDAEAVHTQQVIEQVSSMVSENPDAAANLVKRWLNRT